MNSLSVLDVFDLLFVLKAPNLKEISRVIEQFAPPPFGDFFRKTRGVKLLSFKKPFRKKFFFAFGEKQGGSD